MIRAFLALPLPAEVRARLEVLQFLLPLPRRVDPADLHLTLVFLGEVGEALLETLDDHLAALRQRPFALALAGAGLFGGPRPQVAWAGVAASEPLARLQAKVARAARAAGATIAPRRFTPHVTLGRFPPPPPEAALRLERAVAGEAGFRAGPWEVADFALWRSHGGGEGPRYEELARYPLG